MRGLSLNTKFDMENCMGIYHGYNNQYPEYENRNYHMEDE
jgi:hypothetical protein